MLTLFVLDSTGAPIFEDNIKAITSFGELPHKIFRVKNYFEVNKKEKTTPWFGVIYDNEYIEEELQASLEYFFEFCTADILIVMKKIQDEGEVRIFKAPRFFRQNVKLQEDSLLPADEGLQFETILNGWILDDPDSV